MFECRVPKPTNPIERDLNVELVQTVLTTEYHDPNVEDSPPNDACEGSQFEYMEFWCMTNEKSHDSSIRSEIEDFLKLPRSKTTISDVLHWWFTNRFHQYCIIFY